MTKKKRPGTGGTPAGGSRSRAGSSSGSGSASGSGSGSGRREPRIGRRTIPQSEGSAPAGTTSPGSGGSGSRSGEPGGNGSGGAQRATPAGLRSAGARSARPQPARPSARSAKAAPPARPSGPRRQGGLFAAFRAPSIYPKLGETFGAAARAVLRSPALVLGCMVLVLAMWFALLGAGLDHVPSFFQNLLAVPPLSSFFDLNLVFSITGFDYAWVVLVLVMTAIRAAIFAVLVSLVVERLDSGRVSMAGLRRGLRCVPSFIGIFFVNVSLIFASQMFQLVLGSSIGGLVFFGALVGGVHFLAFAPIIAVRDGTTARVALGTSIRAARLPGSRHVGMVLLYFFLAFLAPAFVPMSSAFTINPTVGTWAMLLAVSLFHLVVIAGFAYRYGVIEEDVPAASPRRPRQRSSLFGARR